MKFLLENWRQFLTEQNIAYSGIILDKESKQKLLEMPIPEGWEPLAHHMTITMGPLQHPKGKHDFSDIYPPGARVEIPVTAIGRDNRVMAVKVEAPGPINKKIAFPHITVAVNREEGGKPFHSNNIPEENFEPINGITLSGIIGEVPQ